MGTEPLIWLAQAGIAHTGPPLLQLIPPGLSAAAVALAVVGKLLAIADGLMAAGGVAGIARRELVRAQGWRTFAGALTCKLLATLALIFPMQELLRPALSGLTGSWFDGPLAFFAIAGSALLVAVTVAVIFAALFLLLDRASRRPGWVVPVAERLGRALGGWAGYIFRPRSNGDDDSDFEITMASGEEVEDEQREYIENILELGDTTVREVMKPRPDVAALDADWPAERILAEVSASRYSRFPAYEQTVDNVIGILHIRDLFEFLARGEGTAGFDLRALTKEPHFIPESKRCDEVLRELQRLKLQLAVVLDEYGGTAGIVTIEDLLEEIVGEIQDEYDDEARQVNARDDGSYVVTANLPLDDLNELLGAHLEAEDVDTVGGFIVGALGRIPAPQDQLDEGGLRFTVLSVDRQRVGRVKVERIAEEAR